MGSVLRRDGWRHVRRVALVGAVLVTLGLAGCKGAAVTTASSAIVSHNGPPDRTAGAFTPYAVPTAGGSPEALVIGPDGNLWFTELNRSRIGSITTQGVMGREYGFPDTTSAVYALAVGPDQNLWYASFSLGKIGYLTMAGKVKQFTLSSTYARPLGITAGPAADGALWFTESAATINGQIVPAIGRITTDGAIKEYQIPNVTGSTTDVPTSVPQMIVRGPDDKLWFTDAGNNTITSVTTDGIFTTHAIPTPNSRPFSIIVGKANDLWFTEQNAIGHYSLTSNKITEYRLPTIGTGVRDVALGPDGSVWCTQFQTNALSKLNVTDGTFTSYPLTGTGERPDQIVLGPDGLLWFTAPGSNSIDAFALP